MREINLQVKRCGLASFRSMKKKVVSTFDV